ncbi:MAG: polysaccharide pyruvyl transferase family protein [Lachnospiraceae bacterium]|nr:polysaccharide pyruvyl transferase family protein [Lachnospiraceae bacterium]
MRIGIITFHRALNCGAILQAYALSMYLSEINHKVEIIDYCPKWSDEDQVLIRELFFDFKLRKVLLFPFRKLFRKKCNDFLNNYCILSACVKTLEDVKKLNQYDVYITGSDQVWNIDITGGFDEVYFLDFETTAKKVSYAASCGKDDIDKKLVNLIAQSVKTFDAVSVREHVLEQALKSNGILNICSVWDPVFLLNANQYSKLQRGNGYKNYLLLYTKGRAEGIRKIAKQVADKYSLAIVDTSKIKKQWPADYVKRVYGPSEFLGLFAHANFIITNSFHGTAFSIIFRKSFYSLENGNKTSRISSLLSDIGLDSRLVHGIEGIDEITQVDYLEYESKIEEHIYKSKMFLKSILK